MSGREAEAKRVGGSCKGCAEEGRETAVPKRCERCGEWACKACERVTDDEIFGCAWCWKREEYFQCQNPNHVDDYGGAFCLTDVMPERWREEMEKRWNVTGGMVRLCWNCTPSCYVCEEAALTKECCVCKHSVCIKCVAAFKDVRDWGTKKDDEPENAITCKNCKKYLYN